MTERNIRDLAETLLSLQDAKKKKTAEDGIADEAPAEEEVKRPPAKKVRRAKAVAKAVKSRSEQVIADIAAGEFEAAAIIVGEMLEEKPNGAAALNLKAAL